jgi:Resolvase, N terminal domain
MRIGCARVSTAEQNLYLQIDALKAAQCGRIYEEHASGKNAGRTELQNCLKALRAGDVLVVWRLDCLGRNLPDLVRIVAELEGSKVGLESITEKIETVSSTGKLVFHIFSALAEFERNVIRERTVAGLKAARPRAPGWPPGKALRQGQAADSCPVERPRSSGQGRGQAFWRQRRHFVQARRGCHAGEMSRSWSTGSETGSKSWKIRRSRNYTGVHSSTMMSVYTSSVFPLKG